MSRPVRALSIPLGVALALALAACGADDERDSAATLTTPPPTTTQATAPTTTGATTVATTGTTPAPPSTTTTPSSGGAPATTTAPPSSGGASPTTPTTPQPAGGSAPATCADAVGGFISGVRASGTDCAVAGEVARAWFDAIDGGAAPDAPITAAGFACGGAMSGQVASVSCEGKGGRVTFTASP